jgi:ABC-type cobalamin transport system permease subunit
MLEFIYVNSINLLSALFLFKKDNEQIVFAITYQIPAIIIGIIIIRIIPDPRWRALFVLPGTFIHELLHFLIGFITFGRPTSFSIIPYRAGPKYWVMGSVGFLNLRWYNSALIGMAPLLAFVAGIVIAPSKVGWHFSKSDFEYWCFSAPILAMAMPSWTDVKISTRSAIPIALFIAYLTKT